jgi:hypothetical protein
MFDPYDPAIRRVRARLATLPWEQEGFVGQVLSRESSDGLLDYLNVSPVPMPPAVKAAPPVKYSQPLVKQAVNRLMNFRARTDSSDLRTSKWKLILAIDLKHSRAGRQILEDCDKGDPLFENTIKHHINDCLGTKADSTVSSRANALIKYLNWHSIRFLDSPYPISEKAVYEYLHSNIHPTGGVAFFF